MKDFFWAFLKEELFYFLSKLFSIENVPYVIVRSTHTVLVESNQENNRVSMFRGLLRICKRMNEENDMVCISDRGCTSFPYTQS